MFGLVDIGFGSHKTQNTNGTVSVKTSGIMDGSNAGSRLGFRGTEDLGGGLSASFTVEQGISPTSADGFNKRVGSSGHQIDGAGTYTMGNSRQAFLGLASKDLGSVRIGYQYTNSYDLVAFNGLSPSEFQGGNFQNGSTLVAGATLSTHANGSRANAITYISNSMGGFTVKAQYGQGAGRQTAESTLVASAAAAAGTAASAAGDTGTNGFLHNNNKYTSLMLQYAQGPIYAAVAYSKADIRTNPGTSVAVDPYGGILNSQPAAAAAAAPAATAVNRASRSINGYNLGASYDFGMAKVSYVGANMQGPTGNLTGGLVVDSKVRADQFAVFVPVGAITLSASTGKAKRTTGATVNNDVKGTYFGARYALSKRTTAYVLTGSEKDKAVTTASANSANHKDSKTVMGVSHSF